MRGLRFAVLVAIMLAGGLLVVPLLPASADAPPYTAVATTGPVTGTYGHGSSSIHQSGAAVTVGASTTSSPISFSWTGGSISLTPSGPFAVGAFSANTSPGSGAYLNLSSFGPPCTTFVSGNVLQADSSGGNLTDFAADISLYCTSNEIPIRISLRWNSTQSYESNSVDYNGWNFGSEAIGVNGWSHTFTVTNTSPTAETFQSVSIPGVIAQQFLAPTSTCISGGPIAPGATCTVTVTPKPKGQPSFTPGTSVSAYVELVLADGAIVPSEIAITPTSYYPLFAQPSLAQITFFWTDIPRVLGENVKAFTVLRGTSPANLVPLKAVTSATVATGSYTDTTVTPGTGYYYALQYSEAGLTTSPVAAEAWPRYSTVPTTVSRRRPGSSAEPL